MSRRGWVAVTVYSAGAWGVLMRVAGVLHSPLWSSLGHGRGVRVPDHLRR